MNQLKPTRITVVMAPYSSSSSITSTLEMFDSANALDWINERKAKSDRSAQRFQVETVSIDGQAVPCTGGLNLMPDKAMTEVEHTDLIIIPGFLFSILSILPSLEPICDWLKLQSERGAQIASICTGAFIVAEAGLLDQHHATTHWAFLQQFKKRYPEVIIKEDHTVTDDNGRYCSGGATAAIDLLIYLVRRFGSAELAAECSRKLLVDTSRRSQRPYVQHNFKRNHEDAKIFEIQQWLETKYASEVSFDELAKEFGFGPRNFMRRFKNATGDTPNQYLQNLRLEQAKQLLETSKINFEQITYQVGYEDSNSFRRLFKKRVGIGPNDYRKKFQF